METPQTAAIVRIVCDSSSCLHRFCFGALFCGEYAAHLFLTGGKATCTEQRGTSPQEPGPAKAAWVNRPFQTTRPMEATLVVFLLRTQLGGPFGALRIRNLVRCSRRSQRFAVWVVWTDICSSSMLGFFFVCFNHVIFCFNVRKFCVKCVIYPSFFPPTHTNSMKNQSITLKDIIEMTGRLSELSLMTSPLWDEWA